MKIRVELKWLLLGMGLTALLAAAVQSGCAKRPAAQRGDVAEAAVATYVAPGDTDEYYLFYSGGHSGQVFKLQQF